MHRYGLVKMWHLENQRHQQTTPPQEEQDGSLHVLRNGDCNNDRSNSPVSYMIQTIKSDSSHESHSRTTDIDLPEPLQVIRARRQLAMARRKLEKTEVDLEESENRVKELVETLTHQAAGGSANSNQAQEELEILIRENNRIKNHHQLAETEYQQKMDKLNRAQQRKKSL